MLEKLVNSARTVKEKWSKVRPHTKRLFVWEITIASEEENE